LRTASTHDGARLTRTGTDVSKELSDPRVTAANDDDEQAERQVASDDLADAVEAGARPRPVLDIDGAFERQQGCESPDMRI
jgi:hypothetical protein